MKNCKKLHSGMTLVEVVIAMGIFAAMTLGITMAFSAAVKFNARNIRRDYELNQQQTALEKNTIAGVKVYPSISSLKTNKLRYIAPGNVVVGEIENVTEYNAIKSKQNAQDINFEIKTFSSTTLDSQPVTFDKDSFKYKLSFMNMSDKVVDIRLEPSRGTIYEVDPDTGYRHTSPLYKRSIEPAAYEFNTLQAPSGFDIGYDSGSQIDTEVGDSYMHLSVYYDGSRVDVVDVPNSWFVNSESGALYITVDSSGNVGYSNRDS